MADTKLTALTATTSPASTDIVYVVVDPGTTPVSKKSTLANLRAGIGTLATDPLWDAAGDLAVGTGADTAGKLAKGATGTVLTAGASTLAYALPPGYEFDYVQKTTATSITATTEGTANTIVTGAAVTYDGSTIVMVNFFAYNVTKGTNTIYVILKEGATVITYFYGGPSVGSFKGSYRFTPAAGSHTYVATAFVDGGTGTISAGAGGADYPPSFMQITKVK